MVPLGGTTDSVGTLMSTWHDDEDSRGWEDVCGECVERR